MFSKYNIIYRICSNMFSKYNIIYGIDVKTLELCT